MDEETIIKAKCIAAVLCRVVDYHAVVSALLGSGESAETVRLLTDMQEQKVAVAIEHLIDAEVFK